MINKKKSHRSKDELRLKELRDLPVGQSSHAIREEMKRLERRIAKRKKAAKARAKDVVKDVMTRINQPQILTPAALAAAVLASPNAISLLLPAVYEVLPLVQEDYPGAPIAEQLKIAEQRVEGPTRIYITTTDPDIKPTDLETPGTNAAQVACDDPLAALVMLPRQVINVQPESDLDQVAAALKDWLLLPAETTVGMEVRGHHLVVTASLPLTYFVENGELKGPLHHLQQRVRYARKELHQAEKDYEEAGRPVAAGGFTLTTELPATDAPPDTLPEDGGQGQVAQSGPAETTSIPALKEIV